MVTRGQGGGERDREKEGKGAKPLRQLPYVLIECSPCSTTKKRWRNPRQSLTPFSLSLSLSLSLSPVLLDRKKEKKNSFHCFCCSRSRQCRPKNLVSAKNSEFLLFLPDRHSGSILSRFVLDCRMNRGRSGKVGKGRKTLARRKKKKKQFDRGQPCTTGQLTKGDVIQLKSVSYAISVT